MPLDPSIFQNVGPKPLDIGGMIDMARSKQRLDAESAMGDIFAGAANPDGTIDTGRLGSPENLRRAGPMAGLLAQQSQALSQGQNILDGQKMENARNFMKILDAKMFPLLSEPDETLHDKILHGIHDLIGHENSALRGGMFTPSMAVEQASNFQGKTPYQQRTMIGQMHAAVIDALQNSEVIHNGVFPPGHPLAGNPMSITRGGAVVHNAQQTGGPGAPPIPKGGAYQEPGARAPAVGSAPQSVPGVPRGAMQGEPTAAFGAAAPVIGAASAASANHLTEANDTSMVRKGMLGNLEDDIEKFVPGPGADWTKLGKAWVNRNVPLPENWKFDPQSIASQDQFNKQAAMLAQSQFAAIGGTGTDAKFESAFTTSPNETLSKLGNKGIIRLLKGNEDAIQAKNEAWQRWLEAGNGPETFAKFSRQFNQHFDPRAFQFKYIPQKERQAYVDKMDPADRQRFIADLTHAHQQGWIKFPTPE